MASNIIKIKSFDFALRIVKLYRFLFIEKKEFVFSKQLLRSGTSVGALVRESEHAERKLDFIHKLAIAQKEANESDYWLELLFRYEYLNESQYESLNSDIVELKKIIASIIISTKNNLKNSYYPYSSAFTTHNSPFIIHN
ncbi:four helix bundle protein [Flavobacterium sp. GSP14]|uniref:four helix bundle protein n=1 Tax=Flavobacterium sp. GSP14 TaxID=3401734 RepID=UPI003AAD726C